MPRPGPRPYECVRRAWHSDRHQPMRGSLIQEIFRIADETHSPATKKNKEWQEKLPVVVLRSEEIMYSKANSEAEYMDLKTLRERTSEAINTIIRRDESTETGDLLPPCIEAALNLGCTPRRTSRSQRNINPRCYLNTSSREPTSIDNFNSGGTRTTNLTFIKPTTSMNLTQNPVFGNNDYCTNKFTFASENVAPSSNKRSFSMETHPNSKCSVYPLYYGTSFRFDEPEPPKTNVVEKNRQNHDGGFLEKPCEIVCDLSLRLAPVSVPCENLEHNQLQKLKDIGSSSPDVNKSGDLMPQINKQILFCSRPENYDPSLGIHSIEWRIEEGLEGKARKRKATDTLEDQHHICWPQSKIQHNQLTGRMKNAADNKRYTKSTLC